MNPKKTDWISIEGEYRAGVATLRDIAGRHGITEGAIRKRAKTHGWTRDPSGTKRQIVRTAMAGGTQNGTLVALHTIQAAAELDIEDMQRALRINRQCLISLEVASETVTEPREIKVIVEAASAAVESIRRIRGLDEPSNTLQQQVTAAELAEAVRRVREEF